MPGIQDFTYLNWGKEATRGVPVPPTRKWIGDATGVLAPDLSLSFHETENRGRRATMFRVTQQAEDVVVKVRADATFDDWVWPLTQLKGGQTGTGAGADKTWSGAPSMTALNNQEAYSLDIGDDTGNYRAQYAMWRWFTQKAGLGDVTSLEGELFAQRVQKVAKATPADPALSPKLVADLWTVKFASTFAGLPGASVQANFLTDHELHVDTGLIPHHYQDGNYWFGQHIETSFGGTLKMTVESTALAISEFYDKWYSQTIDYVRLRNQSPVVLGGSFPSLQHDFAVAYSLVAPIGDEQDGVNLYKVEANLIDDGTNPLISPTLVCSLAAIP